MLANVYQDINFACNRHDGKQIIELAQAVWFSKPAVFGCQSLPTLLNLRQGNRLVLPIIPAELVNTP
jgi:hypothetical protein